MTKTHKSTLWYTADNLIGWLGVAFVLSAYCLVSFGVVSALTVTFQGLTFLGSVGVMLVSYRRRAMQPFALNLVFAIISLIALVRISNYL